MFFGVEMVVTWVQNPYQRQSKKQIIFHYLYFFFGFGTLGKTAVVRNKIPVEYFLVFNINYDKVSKFQACISAPPHKTKLQHEGQK